MTTLFTAVSYNDDTIVERLLKVALPVNMIDPKSGRTALFAAVVNDNHKIAELLLQNGADPNIDIDLTVLHVAVSKRSRRMVDLLVLYGVKLDRRMKQSGKTALYLAVETDQTDIATLLLYYGANVSLSEIQGRTLLQVALNNWNEPLSLLLAQCSPSDNIDFVDYGLTALHLAVERGYIKVVQELINKGANVNQLTFMYTDPLHIAVMNRDRNMVELLARNGAKMNVTADGLSLHYAVNRRYKEIVTLLLDTGVAKISDYNVDGLTALHVAVLSGHLDMAKICIDYHADVNARCTVNNLSPLYYATAKGNRKMVKLLLENGANFDERICECRSLVDNAIMWRNEAISRMFIERGAVINLFRIDDEEGTNMAIELLAQLTFREPNMLNIAKHNLKNIQKSTDQKEYFDLCLQELSEMRDTKVFNNVTFHDLMSPNANKIAAYGRNEDFEFEFVRSGYKQKFPTYATVLSLKYAEARVRGALLKNAEEGFGRLKKFRLPAVCAQKVLQYLENEELKNFIRGVCDCKGRHTCGPEMVITF